MRCRAPRTIFGCIPNLRDAIKRLSHLAADPAGRLSPYSHSSLSCLLFSCVWRCLIDVLPVLFLLGGLFGHFPRCLAATQRIFYARYRTLWRIPALSLAYLRKRLTVASTCLHWIPCCYCYRHARHCLHNAARTPARRLIHFHCAALQRHRSRTPTCRGSRCFCHLVVAYLLDPRSAHCPAAPPSLALRCVALSAPAPPCCSTTCALCPYLTCSYALPTYFSSIHTLPWYLLSVPHAWIASLPAWIIRFRSRSLHIATLPPLPLHWLYFLQPLHEYFWVGLL